MKRWIAVIAMTIGLLAWHAVAEAFCTTHTYFIDDRVIICTTCCYGSSCTTNCFG